MQLRKRNEKKHPMIKSSKCKKVTKNKKSNGFKIPLKIEKKMKNIFFEKGSNSNYASLTSLKREYPIYKQFWESFLQSIPAYSTTLSSKKKIKRLKYISANLAHNFQSDIAYVSKIDNFNISESNNDIKYLLVIIDTLSRFLTVYPLKTKTALEVSKKFELFLASLKRRNIQIFTDDGSEFKSFTKRLFISKGVKHYHGNNNDIKASIVERSIRSLKNIIFKHIHFTKNLHYIHDLPMLVKTLNARVHISTGFPPSDVTEMHVPYIFKKIHESDFLSKNPKPKFQIKNHVHIRKLGNIFTKESVQKFTSELFLIKKVHLTKPIQYSLVDFNGDEIKGLFYTQELIKSNLGADFPIKILQTTKTHVKIHYVNFPDSFDKWILRKNIIPL